MNEQETSTQEQNEDTPLVEKLNELPIMLIEKEGQKTFEDVQAKAPGKQICFCDGYIEGTENWERKDEAFQRENILTIDHHMPLEEMSRNISTTNLAIEYVLKNGPVDTDTVVMITHTDCDSILSSAIIRGILPPKEEFGVAAIAADHTGEPNQIGDLLQSLEQDNEGHEIRDVEFSLRNLEHLLRAEELESRAKELLENRYQDRERALRMVEDEFLTTDSGKVAYAELDKRIDAGLIPGLIPSAEVILIFCPMYDKETKERLAVKEAKLRLGMSAPDGTDLRELMKGVDENWGGRWDAGSNKRHGGTDIDLETYARKLDQAYQEYIQRK